MYNCIDIYYSMIIFFLFFLSFQKFCKKPTMEAECPIFLQKAVKKFDWPKKHKDEVMTQFLV